MNDHEQTKSNPVCGTLLMAYPIHRHAAKPYRYIQFFRHAIRQKVMKHRLFLAFFEQTAYIFSEEKVKLPSNLPTKKEEKRHEYTRTIP